MVVTAPMAGEIKRLRDGRVRPSEIAQLVGVSVRTVQGVLAGAIEGRPLSPREQFDEDARTGWAPDCMDAEEWAEWRAHATFNGTFSDQAARPCTDCPLGFAADMRAEGRCNGTPGGVLNDEDLAEEVEKEDQVDPITTGPAQPDPEPIAPTTPIVWPEGRSDADRAERRRIVADAVARHHGDKSAAARELGVRPNALAIILREHTIRRDHPATVEPRVDEPRGLPAPTVIPRVVEARPADERIAALGRARRSTRDLVAVLEADPDPLFVELVRRARKFQRAIDASLIDAAVELAERRAVAS